MGVGVSDSGVNDKGVLESLGVYGTPEPTGVNGILAVPPGITGDDEPLGFVVKDLEVLEVPVLSGVLLL